MIDFIQCDKGYYYNVKEKQCLKQNDITASLARTNSPNILLLEFDGYAPELYTSLSYNTIEVILVDIPTSYYTYKIYKKIDGTELTGRRRRMLQGN